TWWVVSPLVSVTSKEYASRSTEVTWGQPASGAGPKCVVTVGSPTGLSTGLDGQAAETLRSSLKAAVVPAPLEYRTASVDSTVSPCPLTAATWRRAVRIPSLGKVPLQRSSVGCVSPFPPWRPATVSAGATSESATTSPASSGAEGSRDPDGALGLGVNGFRPDDTLFGAEAPPARSRAAAAITTTTTTAPAIRRARRHGGWSTIGCQCSRRPGQSAGPGARMTVAVRRRLDESVQLKLIFSPARCCLIWAATPSGVVAGWPSTSIRVSPATTPALPAGEPGITSATMTPSAAPPPVVDGTGSLMMTPSWPGTPRWTVALACPASIWAARAVARSIGTAKPTESPAEKRRVAEAAVSMPTTWPDLLTSGPPES